MVRVNIVVLYVLLLILGESILSFTINYTVSAPVFVGILYYVKEVPFYFYFVEWFVFSWKDVGFLSNSFSMLRWPWCFVFGFCSFVNMVNYIDIKPNLLSGTLFFMVDNPFMFCCNWFASISMRIFGDNIHKVYWSVVFFLYDVFVLFCNHSSIAII